MSKSVGVWVTILPMEKKQSQRLSFVSIDALLTKSFSVPHSFFGSDFTETLYILHVINIVKAVGQIPAVTLTLIAKDS